MSKMGEVDIIVREADSPDEAVWRVVDICAAPPADADAFDSLRAWVAERFEEVRSQ